MIIFFMVKYESDTEFCGFYEGWGSTVGVDTHGDMMIPETLMKLQEQMEENSKLRKICLEHNEDNLIGEIIESEFKTEGDITGIKIKVGVVKGREDILEKVNSGELRGFSIGLIIGDLSPEEIKNSDLQVEIDGSLRKSLELFLQKNNIKYGAKVNKSATALSIVGIVLNSLAVLTPIGIYLHSIWRENKDKRIKVNYKGKIYNIDDNFLQKIEDINREEGYYSPVFS